MKNRSLHYLIVAVNTFATSYAMEEAKPTLSSGSVPSLKNLTAQSIIGDIAAYNRPLQHFNQLPLELAAHVINTPLKNQNGTLANFFVAKAEKHRAKASSYKPLTKRPKKKEFDKASKQRSKSLKWLKKFEFILYKGFTNVNGHDEIPLAHSLVRFKKNSLALGLLGRIIKLGACLNMPGYGGHNVLEFAIDFNNFKAVKMITEETLTTINLEPIEYPQPCFLRKIEEYKNTKALYRYLDEHIPVYKQRSRNRYVIAPCCEKRHKPYYPPDILS